MKSLEFSFILKARSEVAQGKCVEGNTSILNRVPFVTDDGDMTEIPAVSGTAMRHHCRVALSLVILDACGLMGQVFERPDPVRLLFAGGSNTGKGNTLRIDEMRALQSLVPSIQLFGGSTKNGIQRGNIEISPAVLICEERMSDLDPWQREALKGRDILPAESYVSQATNYPRDAIDSIEGQALLMDAARTAELNRKIAREKATDDEDDFAADDNKSAARIYSSEHIKRGSLFTWDVVGHVDNELEEATLRACLAAFLRNPIVGKSRSVGWGRLGVFAARNFDHMRPAEALRVVTEEELTDVASGAGLLAHIEARKDEVIAALKAIG